jgi:RNA-directed DNA polymerase
VNAELFSSQNVFLSYLDCRRRKRKTINALSFEKSQVDNLVTLTRTLNGGTYLPRRSVCFINTYPKPREIFAADFYDRVVHHLLVRFLEKYWEKVFIHDSFACRKEKGTLKAVERLSSFIRSVSENSSKKAYYLQLDVKNFFMTIDKHILFDFLDKGLRKYLRIPVSNRASVQDNLADYKRIRDLIQTVIFHDPTENHIKKSSQEKWQIIPPEKSLFNTQTGKGLPIGNLTSQFFANVYMNELDQFVKHRLKAKYYVRYVDDFVLLHEDKDQLKQWQDEIVKFVDEKLKISLKLNEAKLLPLSCGINFLGYIQHIHYRLVRRRVVGNFEKKLEFWKKKDAQEPLTYKEIEKAGAVITSYLAHCSKAKSYKIVCRTLKEHQWLKNYYDIKKWKASIKNNIKNSHIIEQNKLFRGETS